MDYTLRNRVCRGIAKWWDLRNNLSVKKARVSVNRVVIMLSTVLPPVRVDRVNALHSGTTTSYSEYPWHKKIFATGRFGRVLHTRPEFINTILSFP